MLEGRIFMLGVGAQKAGTSWLYNYLSDHPQVALPIAKELHFFDARSMPKHFGNFDRRALKALSVIAERPQPGTPKLAMKDLQKIDRARMVGEDRAYLDLFARLDPATPALGEITPSYTALGEDDFRQIRDFLESAGLKVRPVMLLRDPIERLYSAIRMKIRDTEGRGRKEAAPDAALRRLVKDSVTLRSRYDKTIAALDAAFGPEGVHYEFYETLFNDDAIARICAWLQIDHRPADFGEIRNASPREDDLTPEHRAALRAELAPVYDFCRSRFPGRIPEAWAG
ncbi:MAG: sulfotransferase [Rhodobacteraceae bacterium]|nr:sulfotransferase [Paracoccaceae bacterium]